jgi:potassium-transporting ATPase KdpC subunit
LWAGRPASATAGGGTGAQGGERARAGAGENAAYASGLDEARLHALVAEHIGGRALGFLGEPRVNVPQRNLALDATR